MASLWKHPNSPFWAACFTVHSADGAQLRWKRSLKTRDLKLARKIADALEDAGRATSAEQEIRAFCDKIPDARAKRATAEIFRDVFRAVAGREIGGASLRAFVESWLGRRHAELAPQSFDKYRQVSTAFLESIGAAADREITSFSGRDDVLVHRFRDELAARLSPGTVNTAMKIVRQLFKAAAVRFKIENPSEHVSGIKKRDSHAGGGRRAFTLPEIARVLRVAAGSEWEGMILAGFYTGQRLSDIATWRWENVDLVRKELAFTTRKTNRRVVIPLADALADFLEGLPATDDATAFVFPRAAGHISRAKSEQSGTLSNQFYELLARAGLVRRRSHQKANDGQGRASKRQLSEISFHSFRHTATSLLKNAGIPQSVVMDIVGHESKAISQIYTHVGDVEKKVAVAALPSLADLLRAGAIAPPAAVTANASLARKPGGKKK